MDLPQYFTQGTEWLKWRIEGNWHMSYPTVYKKWALWLHLILAKRLLSDNSLWLNPHETLFTFYRWSKARAIKWLAKDHKVIGRPSVFVFMAQRYHIKFQCMLVSLWNTSFIKNMESCVKTTRCYDPGTQQ